MSRKSSWVRDNDGDCTHIRETSGDGRRSDLYKVDSSPSGLLIWGGKGDHLEVADHKSNGETKAYEADNSFFGSLLSGGRGKEK